MRTDKKLLVFEGLDGCGKDTQINLLKEKYGDKVRVVRNLTDSYLGKYIRECSSNGVMKKMSKYEIASLYLIELKNTIREIDDIVENDDTCELIVCSRWWYSTYAYLFEENTDMSFIEEIKDKIDLQEPKILSKFLFINIGPETASRRIYERNNDIEVWEEKGKLEKVYKGYKEIIDQPLDAEFNKMDNLSIVDVHNQVLEIIDELSS